MSIALLMKSNLNSIDVKHWHIPLDNSVDAGATEIHIKCSPDKKRVIVSDNGSGMDFEAFDRMLSLGYCEKGDTKIGKYGNGFKSGTSNARDS